MGIGLALAAGLAGWWLFSGKPAPSLVVDPVAPDHTLASAEDPAPAAPVAARAVAAGPATRDVVEEPLPVGAVTGRVVDADNAPVPGAKVDLKLWVASIAELGLDRDPRWTTAWDPVTTGSDGTFRFDDLPGGARFSVEAAAQGRTRTRRELTSMARCDLDLGSVVLEPGFAFHGVVVDTQAVPLGGVAVRFSQNGARQCVKSDADGRFRLPPLQPPVHLQVDAEGYVPMERFGREVFATDSDREIRLVMEPAGPVTGRVLERGRGAAAGAHVLIPPLCMDPVRTDQHGRFVLENVPRSGPLEVKVSSPRARPHHDLVQVQGGDQDVEIVLEPVPLLSLRIEDARDGMPLIPGRVESLWWSDDPGPAFTDTARSRARRDLAVYRNADGGDFGGWLQPRRPGEYELPVPAKLDAGGGPAWCAVTVEVEGYQRASSLIVPLAAALAGTPLRVSLSPAGILRGRVIGPDGAPVPAAEVLLMRSDEPGSASLVRWHGIEIVERCAVVAKTRSDIHGTFRFNVQYACNYLLEARSDAFAAARTASFVAGPQHLDANHQDVDIQLTAGGFIAGRVIDGTGDPYPGATLVAWRIDGLARAGASDRAGTYRIGPLPAGPHRLALGRVRASVRRAAGYHPLDRDSSTDLAEFPIHVDEGRTISFDLDLRRLPQGGIVGSVQVDGLTGGLHRVHARRLDSGTGAPRTGILPLRNADVAEVGWDGRFHFLQLREGRYEVTLAGGDGQQVSLASTQVDLQRGSLAQVDFDLEVRLLAGRVLRDEDSQPLPGIIVVVEDRTGQLIDRKVRTAPDGTFRIETLPADVLHLTCLTLDGVLASQVIDLRAADQDDLEIRIAGFVPSDDR